MYSRKRLQLTRLAVGGVLQPLTGVLAGLDVPTPQPQGHIIIPGDDPDHQFQAPGATDVRGICPTLNALANHGYISRDGITSFAEAANAVQTGYGFGYGLSVFLSALGLLAGGDLITGKYSIGGADSRVPNTIGPTLGLDKHGVFEIDGSITREDVHFGNNANFLLQRWEEYVNISNQYDGQFGAATQAYDNGLRYDYSRETNPEFLAGVAWFAVSHAERVFVYEGLANGTATGAGDANFANIGPFFLNETFPPEWFRRGVPFSLAGAFGEAAALFLANPRELGGNEGLGNFVPLDTNITSLTPAELGCFVLENFLDLAPNQIQPTVVNNLDTFSGFVKGTVAPFFIDDGYFNCNVTTFIEPSASAGVNQTGSQSSSGSPVNGAYPGIGVIAPDSEPS
ncbi:Cloroperoxidase [Viridothelium virens]|uniref:Cloroperoxidase n=1 Tax=Viridothelium virens TaxID=1048519 RepID=A0A6A6HNK5_VIRVR|nr:Cloroperoxidase [Viridothelium virens]